MNKSNISPQQGTQPHHNTICGTTYVSIRSSSSSQRSRPTNNIIRSPTTTTTSSSNLKTLISNLADFWKDGIVSLLGFIRSNANLRSTLLLFLNIIATWIFQLFWSRLFISSEFTMLNNSVRGFDGSLGVEFLQHIGTRGRYLHLLYELIDLLYFIPSVSVFMSCVLYLIFSYTNKSLANIICLSSIVYVLFGSLEHLNSISATFHYDFFSPMKTTRDYLTKASLWCQYKWISFGILFLIMAIGVFCLSCSMVCSGDCFDLSSSNYYYRGVNQDEDSDEESEIASTDDFLGHGSFDSK